MMEESRLPRTRTLVISAKTSVVAKNKHVFYQMALASYLVNIKTNQELKAYVDIDATENSGIANFYAYGKNENIYLGRLKYQISTENNLQITHYFIEKKAKKYLRLPADNNKLKDLAKAPTKTDPSFFIALMLEFAIKKSFTEKLHGEIDVNMNSIEDQCVAYQMGFRVTSPRIVLSVPKGIKKQFQTLQQEYNKYRKTGQDDNTNQCKQKIIGLLQQKKGLIYDMQMIARSNLRHTRDATLLDINTDFDSLMEHGFYFDHNIALQNKINGNDQVGPLPFSARMHLPSTTISAAKIRYKITHEDNHLLQEQSPQIANENILGKKLDRNHIVEKEFAEKKQEFFQKIANIPQEIKEKMDDMGILLQICISRFKLYVTHYKVYTYSAWTLFHNHTQTGRDRAKAQKNRWCNETFTKKILVYYYDALIDTIIKNDSLTVEQIETITKNVIDQQVIPYAKLNLAQLNGGNWHAHSFKTYFSAYIQELSQLTTAPTLPDAENFQAQELIHYNKKTDLQRYQKRRQARGYATDLSAVDKKILVITLPQCQKQAKHYISQTLSQDKRPIYHLNLDWNEEKFQQENVLFETFNQKSMRHLYEEFEIHIAYDSFVNVTTNKPEETINNNNYALCNFLQKLKASRATNTENIHLGLLASKKNPAASKEFWQQNSALADLELLNQNNIRTIEMPSHSWNFFKKPPAPSMQTLNSLDELKTALEGFTNSVELDSNNNEIISNNNNAHS